MILEDLKILADEMARSYESELETVNSMIAYMINKIHHDESFSLDAINRIEHAGSNNINTRSENLLVSIEIGTIESRIKLVDMALTYVNERVEDLQNEDIIGKVYDEMYAYYEKTEDIIYELEEKIKITTHDKVIKLREEELNKLYIFSAIHKRIFDHNFIEVVGKAKSIDQDKLEEEGHLLRKDYLSLFQDY